MVSALLAQSNSVWLPTDASTLAPEYDSLFYFVLWASVVIFVGVVAAMVWFAYKYRRQSPDERPELVEESQLMEISWVNSSMSAGMSSTRSRRGGTRMGKTLRRK